MFSFSFLCTFPSLLSSFRCGLGTGAVVWHKVWRQTGNGPLRLLKVQWAHCHPSACFSESRSQIFVYQEILWFGLTLQVVSCHKIRECVGLEGTLKPTFFHLPLDHVAVSHPWAWRIYSTRTRHLELRCSTGIQRLSSHSPHYSTSSCSPEQFALQNLSSSQ